MTLLQVVRENLATPIRQMKDAADVYEVMRFLEKEDREKFYTLHVDTKNRIVAMDLVSIGTLTGALVHPREVFKAAILNNSCSVVLVHNHPSGDTSPSGEDRLLTSRLCEAGELLGIKVLDHVIIGDSGFKSVTSIIAEEKAQALKLMEQERRAKAKAAAKKRKQKALAGKRKVKAA